MYRRLVDRHPPTVHLQNEARLHPLVTNFSLFIFARLHQYVDRLSIELIEVLKFWEPNEASTLNDISSSTFHKIDSSTKRPTGGNQIINDQNTLTGLDSPNMHLQAIGSILENVGLGNHLTREFLWLTQRYELGTDG